MTYLGYLIRTHGYCKRSLKVLKNLKDENLKDLYEVVNVCITMSNLPDDMKKDTAIIYMTKEGKGHITIIHKNIIFNRKLFKFSKKINKIFVDNKPSLFELLYSSEFITRAILGYYELKIHDDNGKYAKDILKNTYNTMINNEELISYIHLPYIFKIIKTICKNNNIKLDITEDEILEVNNQRILYNMGKYKHQYLYSISKVTCIIENL